MDRKERYTSFPRIPVQTPVRCVEGRTCSLLLSHVGPARVPSSSRPPHLDPIYKTCSVWVLSHRPCEFMHCLEPAPASVLYRLQATGSGQVSPVESWRLAQSHSLQGESGIAPVAGGWIWSAAPPHTCSMSQVPARGQQLLIYGGENEKQPASKFEMKHFPQGIVHRKLRVLPRLL